MGCFKAPQLHIHLFTLCQGQGSFSIANTENKVICVLQSAQDEGQADGIINKLLLYIRMNIYTLIYIFLFYPGMNQTLIVHISRSNEIRFKSDFSAPLKILHNQYPLLSWKINLAVSLLFLLTPTCWGCFTSYKLYTHRKWENSHSRWSFCLHRGAFRWLTPCPKHHRLNPNLTFFSLGLTRC